MRDGLRIKIGALELRLSQDTVAELGFLTCLVVVSVVLVLVLA